MHHNRTLSLCTKTIALIVSNSGIENEKEKVCQGLVSKNAFEDLQNHFNNQIRKSTTLLKSLEKQQQLNFILQNFLSRVQKILYNEESSIFKSPLDYEKVELHLKQIIRRLQDIQNSKLDHIPKVYRPQGIKTIKITRKSSPLK